MNEEILEYDKPLCCENDKGNTLLLSAQIAEDRKSYAGWDWFNLDVGEYESDSHFKTEKEACEAYKDYNPTNCILGVEHQ